MTEALVADAKAAFQAGVRAVQPPTCMERSVHIAALKRRVKRARRVYVATIGKAAASWARWWSDTLGDAIDVGCMVQPQGYGEPDGTPLPATWHHIQAGHPHPTEKSAIAGAYLLDMARACGPDDLFLIGLSGGGSACTALPPAGVSMAEVQRLNKVLLRAGMPIDAINAVRKHVLQVGGGRLAAAAYPAQVEAYAISDVPGNDLATIASGPTVGDPTTYEQAQSVLHQADVWDEVPLSIQQHLQSGIEGHHPETPTAHDVRVSRARTAVIATNKTARRAAAQDLEARGYTVRCPDAFMTGTAREEGRAHAIALRDALPHTAIVWGGEPTVRVTGSGTGGRNQEAALAAVHALAAMQRPAVLLCAGTDGIDGPTDAAGAWVTPRTQRQAKKHGCAPNVYLADNNSYAFFEQVGGLYRPGPTQTNVMDVHIGVVAPSR